MADDEDRMPDAKYQVLPRLPKGVHLGNEQKALWDNLWAQADAGVNREQNIFALRRFLDQVNQEIRGDEPTLSNVVIQTEFTNRDGEIAIRETDGLGNVREIPVDRTAAEERKAVLALRIEEDAAILEDLHEVDLLRQGVAGITDPAAGDTLRQRADELMKSTRERQEKLRDAVPSEEWGSFPSLKQFTVLTPEVQAIADMVAGDGRIADIFERWTALTPQQQQEVRQAVPEFESTLDQMIRYAESHEETA